MVIIWLTNASAVSMKDLWFSLPDSMIPYLDAKKRTECIDMYRLKLKAKNALGGETAIDTITGNYLSATLSNNSILQMRRILSSNADSLVCVVRTFWGPVKDSKVTVFTTKWKEVCNVQFKIDDFTHKPDTMNTELYEKTKKMLDPYMFFAKLNPKDDTLTVEVTVTGVSEEENNTINDIILQRKLNWNGKCFN